MFALVLMTIVLWVLYNQHRGVSWKNGIFAALTSVALGVAYLALLAAMTPAIGS